MHAGWPGMQAQPLAACAQSKSSCHSHTNKGWSYPNAQYIRPRPGSPSGHGDTNYFARGLGVTGYFWKRSRGHSLFSVADTRWVGLTAVLFAHAHAVSSLARVG